MNIDESMVKTYACMYATNSSRAIMNTENRTEAALIEALTAGPMATVRKTSDVNARMIMCPAKILANRRIVRARGFVRIPKNSII